MSPPLSRLAHRSRIFGSGVFGGTLWNPSPHFVAGIVLLAAPRVGLTAAPTRVVLRSPRAPIVGDGTTVVELQLEISARRSAAKDIQVRVTRGKILATGPVVNGIVPIRYLPPTVDRDTTVSLSIAAHVGHRRIRRTLRLHLVVPGEQAEPLPASDDPEKDETIDVSASEHSLEAKPKLDQEDPEEMLNAPPDPNATYVLWDIGALGIDTETVRSLTAMVRGELRRVLGDRFITSEDWVDEQTRRSVSNCGEFNACLSEAALALNATRLINGVIGSMGDHYVINLRLLDAHRQQPIARAKASLTGERNQLLNQIQVLVLKLVAPDRLTGVLALETELKDANVYVDGDRVGTTPLKNPIDNLTAGQHSLKVSSPHIEDYFTFFTIHYGKTTNVEIDARQVEVLKTKLRASGRTIGLIGVALKGGYITSLGAISTGLGLTEVSVELPILLDGFEIGVEAGFQLHESPRRLAQTNERVSTTTWSVPLMARLAYRLDLGVRFSLRFSAGGGAYVVGTSVRSESLRPVSSRKVYPAVGGALGGGLALGPGRALAELAYTYVFVEDRIQTGNVAGLAAVVGYRLEF